MKYFVTKLDGDYGQMNEFKGLNEKQCLELHRVLSVWKDKKLLTRYVDQYIQAIVFEGKADTTGFMDTVLQVLDDPKKIREAEKFYKKLSKVENHKFD